MKIWYKLIIKLIIIVNFIFLSVFLGLIHLINTPLETDLAAINSVISSVNSAQGLTDPIWIVGDDDLKAQAALNNWDVGGTKDGSYYFPFLILGKTVSGTGTLIYFKDTTLHFNFYQNVISGGNTAIYLWNVSNAKIYNNEISDSAVSAIYVRECSGPLLVMGNTISNVTEQGIYLSGSNRTVILRNDVSTNGTGIYLYGSNSNGPCTNNSVVNNTITNNLGYGISLYGANNNTIESNELINTSVGIYLSEDDNAFPARPRIHNNTIINNTVMNSIGNGIYLDYSMNNTLINNRVKNTTGSGIEIYGSRNNTLVGNNFTDSGSGYGIRLQFANEMTMIDNRIENGSFMLFSGSGMDPSLYYQRKVHGNLVNGNPLIYWQNVHGGIVPTNAAQVFIINSTDIEISDLNLYDVYNSMTIAFSSRLNIHHNSINSCMLGLEINNITDSAITSNLIYDIGGSGINIFEGKDLTITNNTINECGGGSITGGIVLEEVYDSLIAENIIQDAIANGFYIESSFNNTIYQNNLSVHHLTVGLAYGMIMYLSDDNWIVNNLFFNFTNNAIFFNTANNNSILANTIKNSTEYGIYLLSSTDVTIKFNSMIDNNLGSTQAYDNSISNLFKYNYWNDMTGPDDSPVDGFVDNNYTIAGVAKNNDTRALTTPFSVTPPVVVFPNGGETLKENISIQWTAASDTLGFSFKYDLYYSNDAGITWILIINDLDETSFEWASLELSNSPLYLIKVIAHNTEGFFAEDKSDDVFTVQNVLHSLSSPVITSPLGGDTINGIVNIQWNASIDSWNHTFAVTYELQYSADGGISWNSLTTSSLTSFLWDTNTVNDGSNYIFKVTASNIEDLNSSFITSSTITIQNHILSNPMIIFPNGGEKLVGTVEIQWMASSDSKSHTVNYTVYYSSDGENWIMLVSGLTTTNVSWDTTSVNDGTNYLIKVITVCSLELTAEDTSNAPFTIENTPSTTTTTTTTTTTITTTTSFPITNTSSQTSSDIATISGDTPGWTGFITLLIIGVLILLRKKGSF